MKAKIKNFFTNKINVIVVIIAAVAVALIVIGCFCKDIAQNILISLGTNVFTSTVLFFLIDQRIEEKKQKDDEKHKRKNERKNIIKYHMSLEAKLTELYVQYNQLVIPYEDRIEDNKFLPLKRDGFEELEYVSQLIDIFNKSATVYGRFGETSLSAFIRTHDKMVEQFRSFLLEIDFDSYDELKKALEQINTIASMPNCMESLESLQNQKAVVDTIKVLMKSYDGNMREDIVSQKYSGNLLLQPLTLCYYLCTFSSAVEKYVSEINKIKLDKKENISKYG